MAKNVAEVAAGARRNGNHKPKVGLRFNRFSTPPGSHAYDLVEWERRTASITGEKGQVIFEQKDVEVPRSWSQLAINVVAQKYFRGSPGSPERETSVRQIIDRVVDTIANWGRQGSYFATEDDAANWAEELRFLLVTQHASFNSPVWFNIGLPSRSQQASACFINSVQDSMESILDLAKTEGMLFKFGSGTGTNLSVLRSSKEQLSGGGTASGPVSFMKGYDSFAGSIKSGGTTRRAAKMVILNADHPDVVDFIHSKAEEEKKAWALIEAGYNAGFNVPGGAYDSVQFQNANHSVRVTDDFMRAVIDDKEWKTKAVVGGRTVDTYKARDLWREIADAAWMAQVKGPFSEYAKNREPMLRVMEKHRAAAHQLTTSPESADVIQGAKDTWDEAVKLGRAHGYRNAQATVLAPTGCLVGDILVITDRVLVRLEGLGDPDGDKWQSLDTQVATDQGPQKATKFFVNGAEPVVTVETSRGYRIQGTTTHRIKVVDSDGQWTWRRLSDLRSGDRVPMMLGGMVGEPTEVL